MAQYCTVCGKKTNCTDDCRECAKEVYKELKQKAGKSEYVAEEAIRTELGDGAFQLLREHNYIEYCTTIQGRKMYAI